MVVLLVAVMEEEEEVAAWVAAVDMEVGETMVLLAMEVVVVED